MTLAGRILTLQRTARGNGLFIQELATRLGLESEAVALALEDVSKGLLMQNTELEGPMYLMKEDVIEDADHGRLSDMNGCPCFHCIKISRCGVRQADSPVVCRKLEEWMLSTDNA